VGSRRVYRTDFYGWGRKAQNLLLFGRISFGASMGYHMIYLALNRNRAKDKVQREPRNCLDVFSKPLIMVSQKG